MDRATATALEKLGEGLAAIAENIVQLQLDVAKLDARVAAIDSQVVARHMPRWIRDKLTWIVVFAAIAAATSSYSAYKIYLMTDGKTVPTKGKR